MGLLDVLQGASNAAASNISGPVDILAWALRKAGVPVPADPVMGEQWMRQQGLLATPQNKYAGAAGETLGLLGPIAAAAKAPQIAKGLLAGEEATKRGAYAVGEKANDMAQGYMVQQGLMKPATVWHGSPHKFDRFDSSKIGTGEGAQAYGHGLYLAESPEVAVGYQKALAHKAPRIQDEAGKLADYQTTVKGRNAWVFTDESVLIETADGAGFKLAASLRDLRKKAASDSQAFEVASRTDFAAQAKSNLYKVDLPDEQIARMLDWDKPLSQQAPGVRQAVAKAFPATFVDGRIIDPANSQLVGRALMDQLSMVANKRGGAGMRASEPALRAAGIPGIRYLDGGSRGAGTGSSNYVLFPGEEEALRILERNGQALK